MTFQRTITERGQIVIPARLRKKLGIKGGMKISVAEEDGRIVLQPQTRDRIRRLRGILKKGPSALEYLLEQRKKDRLL